VKDQNISWNRWRNEKRMKNGGYRRRNISIISENSWRRRHQAAAAKVSK